MIRGEAGMVDDQDKEIYYPISFLEQMTWVQEEVEHILKNSTLETMRSAGVERFGEPGYGSSIKRLLEIIKSRYCEKSSKLRKNYYYLYMMNTQI